MKERCQSAIHRGPGFTFGLGQSLLNKLTIGAVFVSALTLTGVAAAQTRQTAQASTPVLENRASPAELPTDPEDALLYRVLAAPVYLWNGFAYPIKKLSIFYERVDLLERALDLFLNDERTGGVYPRFSLGGALSSGLGFTAFDNNLFNQNKEGRLSFLAAVRGNQLTEASFIDPAFLGSRYRFETEVEWLDADEGRFYPGGNVASEDSRTEFALSQVSALAGVSRPISGDLSGSFFTRYFVSRGKQSDSGGALIPLSTPGAGPNIQALETELGLRYDSRDNPFAPVKGWLFDTALTYTEQVNGDQFRYTGYSAEVQHYTPIFRDNRILLLRGLVARQNAVDGQSIPFYELNMLDLNNGLRGYSRGRWRDQGKVLFNAEWRWPVWERFSGSLFYDTGRVFRHFRDLDDGGFRDSVGFGFRFATRRQFTFRAQLAYSDDGVLALLKGDLEFERRRGTQLGGI